MDSDRDELIRRRDRLAGQIEEAGQLGDEQRRMRLYEEIETVLRELEARSGE